MNTNETIDVCTSSFSKKHEFRLHTHQNHILGFVSLLKKPSLRLEVTYAATYLEDLNSTLQLPYIFAANPRWTFSSSSAMAGDQTADQVVESWSRAVPAGWSPQFPQMVG